MDGGGQKVGEEMKSGGAMKVGDRVWLLHGHPWADHIGTCVRFERIAVFNEIHPVIRLDDGHECFVMEPEHYEILSAMRSRRARR